MWHYSFVMNCLSPDRVFKLFQPGYSRDLPHDCSGETHCLEALERLRLRFAARYRMSTCVSAASSAMKSGRSLTARTRISRWHKGSTGAGSVLDVDCAGWRQQTIISDPLGHRGAETAKALTTR
jgi:hypothetical protein